MSHRLAELHRSGPPKLLNRATSAREWTDHRADITRRWMATCGQGADPVSFPAIQRIVI